MATYLLVIQQISISIPTDLKGLKQLRIAETEKYAHVKFFFNGGQEKQYEGEDRILVPSPKVETYDLKPEMSAYEVCDKVVEAIKSEKYDSIILNFANPDMVGHTGSIDAAIKALEAIDECVSKVVKAINEVNGVLLITADHGNCEQMIDYKTGEPHTAHTTNPVPLAIVGLPANKNYNYAMDYYNTGNCDNALTKASLDECLEVVIPIYRGEESDFTGGAMYFHSLKSPNDWAYNNNFTLVDIPGTEGFWFYK